MRVSCICSPACCFLQLFPLTLLVFCSNSPLLNQIPVLAFVVMWISPLIPERLIRVLLRFYPFSADLHRMLDISDTMARRSEEIIGAKKSALAKGDDELAHRVGEGKDIMSILRTCSMLSLLSFNEFLTSSSQSKRILLPWKRSD